MTFIISTTGGLKFSPVTRRMSKIRMYMDHFDIAFEPFGFVTFEVMVQQNDLEDFYTVSTITLVTGDR